MIKNLLIIFLLSVICLASNAETVSESQFKLADFDLQKLEDSLESYEYVIVLFEEKDRKEESEKYLKFLNELEPKLKDKYPTAVLGRFLVSDVHQLPKYYRSAHYPALAFFYKGKKNVYNGELDASKYIEYVSNVSQTVLVDLKTQDEFNNFLKSDKNPKLVAFYTSDSTEEINVLKELLAGDTLQNFDIHQVGLCLEDCEVTFQNLTFTRKSLTLFREYEGVEPVALKRKHLDDITDILEFVNKESVPPVLEIDEVNITKLFGGYANYGMILFVDPKEDNQQAVKALEEHALFNRKELYYERIIHAVFPFDEEWEEIKTFFSLYQKSKLPRLFITQLSNEGIIKFEFNKEKITTETIQEFVEDFRKKNVDRMLISEEEPENNTGLVKQLVGKTFQKEVVSSKDSYVVVFHEDAENKNFKATLKLFEHVNSLLQQAEQKTNNSSEPQTKLKFGQIDMLKNEVQYRSFMTYPQILLYMKGKKARPTEFDLPLTPKAFVAWLNSNLPELGLTLTDMDEVNFIQEKYSQQELQEFEKNKEILNEQEEKLRLELIKIAEEEEKKQEALRQAQQAQEEAQNEEPQPVLSLGGPSVTVPQAVASPVAAEEAIINKTDATAKPAKKQPKKKNEPNTDL